jgi:hypothetical protein
MDSTNQLGVLCLGGVPQTQRAAEAGVFCDSSGYIITGPDLLKNGKHPENWVLDPCRTSPVANTPGRLVSISQSSVAPQRSEKGLGRSPTSTDTWRMPDFSSNSQLDAADQYVVWRPNASLQTAKEWFVPTRNGYPR